MGAMETTPPFEMDVFSSVGEQRQPVKGANHVELLLDRLVTQGRPQYLDGAFVVTATGDCGLTHRLDQFEGLVTRLLADDVSEDAAKEPDVIAELFVRGVEH